MPPTRTTTELARSFNYWDESLDRDPHTPLAQLRAQCPVARSEELGGYWLVTSFERVRQVLTDPHTYSSRVLTLPPEGAPPLLVPETIDPPKHAGYRRVFTPYFTPRRAAQLRERTRVKAAELAAGLATQLAENGNCDFMEGFAVPLPCTVFMELAGFPIADLPQLLEWKDRFMRDGVSDDAAKRAEVSEVVMPAMMSYFNAALDERIAATDPPDDLLTGLVTGEVADGETMTRDEILNALLLMLAAGLDTVTAALGLSVAHLATAPGLRAELVADPDLIPGAVEEFLRYYSLVTTCRQANTDAVLGDAEIKAGDYLAVCGPSAGRDESVFPNADELDIRRTPNPHLAFGVGPHRCLGSHLARMEMAVALEELHKAMPDYRIEPGTEPRRHFGGVMGIDSLYLSAGSE